MRAFIRFCHHERGIRAALTKHTLAAVDAYEPEYQQIIRSDRPQGPAALLAAMGVLDEPEPELSDIMLDLLRRAVGGEATLDTLDAQPLPDEPFAWDAVPADIHNRVGEVLELGDRCCTELLDDEYRTACRRLLADAAGDPEIFRRRSRATTAAAAICWVAGKANSLFDREPVTPKVAVKDLTGHFGISGSGVSQRSEPLLRAIGVDPPAVRPDGPGLTAPPGRAGRASSPTGTATARWRTDMDPAVARLAHDCPLLARARALAAFVGEGRALTAKGVLAPACAATGMPDPGRVVSAADVPALHRAWVAAQGAGLFVLGVDRAVAATPAWDPVAQSSVAQWLGGVTALLRAESDDPERIGATVACRVALSVLDSASGIDPHWFGHAVEDVLDQVPITDRIAAHHAFRRGRMPETGALELLIESGAVDPATLASPRWAAGPSTRSPSHPPQHRPGPTRTSCSSRSASTGSGRRCGAGSWPRPAPASTDCTTSCRSRWSGTTTTCMFTVDGIGYVDPDHGLDGCGDEETVALASALPRLGATLAYRHDLGDCWDHTILLEKVLAAEPGAGYPACLGGRGDAPLEDWNHEPPPPRPFRLAEVDARLAALYTPEATIG